MPWQAARMGTRAVGVLALLLMACGCTSGGSEDPGLAPEPSATSDADCAGPVPDVVLSTLGWTPTGEPAQATVRGCRREADQGYVEVRDRTGYDQLCKTLVEPGGVVGQTKVVVREDGDAALQVTVTALTRTPQAQVRAAVVELLAEELSG
jgi:hypothetical protein